MLRLISILLIGCFFIAIQGCQEKAEAPKEPAQESEIKEEKAFQPPSGQFDGSQINEWIKRTAARAKDEDKKKAEALAGKFSAEEIVTGVALRKIPDYWHKVPASDRSKTIAIMNTGLSKLRIEAGLAENVDTLNSTLYLENEEGIIIASSSPVKGSELFEEAR